VVTVSASNAATVTSNVFVLDYGCIYQDGYIFSIDDATTSTTSIGGKVVAQLDEAPAWPLGVIWSSNGQQLSVK